MLGVSYSVLTYKLHAKCQTDPRSAGEHTGARRTFKDRKPTTKKGEERSAPSQKDPVFGFPAAAMEPARVMARVASCCCDIIIASHFLDPKKGSYL